MGLHKWQDDFSFNLSFSQSVDRIHRSTTFTVARVNRFGWFKVSSTLASAWLRLKTPLQPYSFTSATRCVVEKEKDGLMVHPWVAQPCPKQLSASSQSQSRSRHPLCRRFKSRLVEIVLTALLRVSLQIVESESVTRAETGLRFWLFITLQLAKVLWTTTVEYSRMPYVINSTRCLGIWKQ